MAEVLTDAHRKGIAENLELLLPLLFLFYVY